MSPVNLVLVRHGAVIPPDPAKPTALYGAVDVELSEEGKAEAMRAAAYVRAQQGRVALVVHSGLERARYGAERVVEICGGGVDVVEDQRFKELDRGEWAGLTPGEIGQLQPGGLERLATDPSYRPARGENYFDLEARVLLGMRDLLERFAVQQQDEEQTVVLVAHNWVIRCLVAHVQGLPKTSFVSIPVPTASITTLLYSAAAVHERNTSGATVAAIGVKPQA